MQLVRSLEKRQRQANRFPRPRGRQLEYLAPEEQNLAAKLLRVGNARPPSHRAPRVVPRNRGAAPPSVRVPADASNAAPLPGAQAVDQLEELVVCRRRDANLALRGSELQHRKHVVASPNAAEQSHVRVPPNADRNDAGNKESGQGWIRTSEGVKPADLQSAPFGHSGTYPGRALARTLRG